MANKDFPLLDEADFDALTPVQIENFARYLVRELGEAEKNLSAYQVDYAEAETYLEDKMALQRMHYSSVSRENGKNYTVQQTEDSARLDCGKEWSDYSKLKALVEISKGRINVLKAQSDLVRSVMVSVRTSNEMDRA